MRPASVSCIALGVVTLLAACLPIPHRHLDRPGTTFLVGDSSGRPVPGARLTLYTVYQPSYVLNSALTWTGSADGAPAVVPAVRSRHAVMFFPMDAEAPNVWIWCATAPGHSAEIGEVAAHGQPQPIRVALRLGASTLSCAPSDSGYRAARGAFYEAASVRSPQGAQ